MEDVDRIFLESGPGLAPLRHVTALPLDVTSSEDDISTYLKYRMRRIELRMGSQISDALIQKLIMKSSGLFAWAAAASDALDKITNPTESKLNASLQSFDATLLDTFYEMVLDSVGDWSDRVFVVAFRTAMGIILEAKRPLSNKAIASLGAPQVDESRTIAELGSILYQSPQVHLMHPSLSGFFFDLSRCRRGDWMFHHSALNHFLGLRCLECLNQAIGEALNENLPEHVVYACEYWVNHICDGTADPDIRSRTEEFLRHHLLLWLEVMSVMKQLDASILQLGILVAWASVSNLLSSLFS